MDTSAALELPGYFVEELDGILQEQGLKDYKVKVEPGSFKGENYFGVIHRIIINGSNDHGDAVEVRFILKSPPQLPIIREKFPVAKMYIREAFIYDTFLPKLNEIQDTYNIPKDEKFQFVRCFKTSGEHMKEYLLLDDICAKGYKLHQRRLPLPYDQVKLILVNMARLHALSFTLKRDDPEIYKLFSSSLGGMSDFASDHNDELFKMALDTSADALDDKDLERKLREFGKGLGDKFLAYFEPEPIRPYTVLTHGDCWNNNLMFLVKDGKVEDCRFLDWQMAKEGSPVLDIAYFFFNSTDYELRKEHFNDLMDLYHETMGQFLAYMNIKIEDVYPRKIFDDQIKTHLTFGLCVSLMLLRVVLGESEDAVEIEDIISVEGIDRMRQKEFDSSKTLDRYKSRLDGVVRSFSEMGFI